MNPNINNRFNPLGTPYWYQNQPQQYDIIKVNGENGARAFQMGPNSRMLLLDENDPIVWFVQTDGAGYKTIDAYDIVPHKVMPQIDIQSLEARISMLEEQLNVKSNSRQNKQTKRQSATESSVVSE